MDEAQNEASSRPAPSRYYTREALGRLCSINEDEFKEYIQLLEHISRSLGFPWSTIVTEKHMLRRYCLFYPIYQSELEDVMISCVFFAAKLEESVKKIRDIIQAVHIAIAGMDDLDAAAIEDHKRQAFLIEKRFLEISGFDFEFIYPHTYVIKFAKHLGVPQSIAANAWDLVDKCFATHLPLLYPPQVLAFAALWIEDSFRNFGSESVNINDIKAQDDLRIRHSCVIAGAKDLLEYRKSLSETVGATDQSKYRTLFQHIEYRIQKQGGEGKREDIREKVVEATNAGEAEPRSEQEAGSRQMQQMTRNAPENVTETPKGEADDARGPKRARDEEYLKRERRSTYSESSKEERWSDSRDRWGRHESDGGYNRGTSRRGSPDRYGSRYSKHR
ncbi:uncharacterized protein BJ171DRAFT_489002 [Polychytrium aggregatum]|uniref:uncharacterized protein n=1 Tax=Polychytrium aggregatum TaxID=110093 RepID=UPI0022FEBF45|nr:uncharacterized protein BJ171DRAFT_489002 [Polychytrium aggregatum]KAI9208478.1 hypothetical protein BJ171DRAFT_489002 [Polychytrium aggregatum]